MFACLYPPSSQSTSFTSSPVMGFPTVPALMSSFSITVPVQELSVRLYPCLSFVNSIRSIFPLSTVLIKFCDY